MPTTFRRRTAAAPATFRYRDTAPADDDSGDEPDEPRSRSRGRGERPSRSRDEEPAEEPRSRRRARDDDDDDEPPARGRGRSRAAADDDDDDDDEPPARSSRRGRAEPDDDDEPPRGRATRAAARSRDKDSGRSSSRRRSRDDDDEPRSRKVAKGGWDSYKKQREASYTDDEFKIQEGDPEVLIKIMDDEPFATYRQHWVEGLTSTKRKSWNCLEDDTCPLCNMGIDPKPHALFNVVLMDGDTPVLKVWDCGAGIVQILEKKAAAKTGPLSKEYYAVSKDKSGANHKGPVQWEIEVVRERDLLKEWDTEPLTDDELDDFDKDLFGPDYVKWPTLSELRKIAREADGED